MGRRGGWWASGSQCPDCQAAQELAAERRRLGGLVASSGIPSRYAWANFDRFSKQGRAEVWADFRDRLDAETAELEGPAAVLGVTGWNARAAAAVRDWRPTVGHRPRVPVLFLTGPVGSGKTTLAAAAIMGALRSLAKLSESDAERYRVTWISSGDLWETLRLESGRKKERGALARWAAAEVLVLDDLGTLEQVKPWQRDAMEFLICQRYNAQRATVITSNLRLDSVDAGEPTIASLYGERVISRLVEGMGGRRRGTPPGYLELLGMDWRADVPHPQPDPSRPASPAATPATTAKPSQLGLDWRQRQSGERDE